MKILVITILFMVFFSSCVDSAQGPEQATCNKIELL